MPGGLTYTFGVSSTLKFNDNYNLDNISPGNSTILDTRLSFGLLKQTRVDTFSLLLDGVIRVADLPTGSDMRFDDPGVVLRYVREGANSQLTADAKFSRTNLDFIDPFKVVGDVQNTDLITDVGEREEPVRAPDLGDRTECARSGCCSISGTRISTIPAPPTLISTTAHDVSYGITTRLRLSPVADGRVVISQEDYSADDADQTDQRTRELSFGVAYAISPITKLDATLGVQEVRARR